MGKSDFPKVKLSSPRPRREAAGAGGAAVFTIQTKNTADCRVFCVAPALSTFYYRTSTFKRVLFDLLAHMLEVASGCLLTTKTK